MTAPAAAVVFDMDGVLVDTEPISRAVIADIYRHYGHEVSAVHLDALVGVHVDEAINMLCTAYPVAVGNDVIRGEYEQNYLPRLDTCVPAAGVHELITSIRDQGLLLGLASSASRNEIESVLGATGLKPYFHAIYSGDDVVNPKPNPEIYLATVAQLNVEPAAALAIEDSPFGVTAAIAAGLFCVGIRSPRVRGLDLSQANVVVDTLVGQTVASLWAAAQPVRTPAG
jgi:putative hydrolase of the HAD superfamily